MKLLVKVIKGDWQSQKVLYMSNPMTIMDAMAKIKELVLLYQQEVKEHY